MAEKKRFELLNPVTGYTISSRAPSTGLGDFSISLYAAFGQVRRLVYDNTSFEKNQVVFEKKSN